VTRKGGPREHKKPSGEVPGEKGRGKGEKKIVEQSISGASRGEGRKGTENHVASARKKRRDRGEGRGRCARPSLFSNWLQQTKRGGGGSLLWGGKEKKTKLGGGGESKKKGKCLCLAGGEIGGKCN